MILNRIKILAGVVFLACSTLLSAQKPGELNFVLLQGVVMDAVSQEALTNVHFVLNRTMAGISDDNGKFSVYLNKADTLVFSYIGYQDFVFVLSDTLMGKAFIAGVFMRTDTLTVGEVVVMPRIMDLKAQIRSSNPGLSPEMINAQNNITSSAYQGLNSQAQLGDPAANYNLLIRKQKLDAYEEGGIPSDRMLGLNMLNIIPTAIYLLVNGKPQRPEPPKPRITQQELNRMKELYKQDLSKKDMKKW